MFNETDLKRLPGSLKICAKPPDEILGLFLWCREHASLNDLLAQVGIEQERIGSLSMRPADYIAQDCGLPTIRKQARKRYLGCSCKTEETAPGAVEVRLVAIVVSTGFHLRGTDLATGVVRRAHFAKEFSGGRAGAQSPNHTPTRARHPSVVTLDTSVKLNATTVILAEALAEGSKREVDSPRVGRAMQ